MIFTRSIILLILCWALHSLDRSGCRRVTSPVWIGNEREEEQRGREEGQKAVTVRLNQQRNDHAAAA